MDIRKLRVDEFNTRYITGPVVLVFTHYQSNLRPAIQLLDAESGEPLAKATLNIPDADIAEDEVIIKDYSENEGMLAALQAADIIHPPHGEWQIGGEGGWFKVPICRLTYKAKQAMK